MVPNPFKNHNEYEYIKNCCKILFKETRFTFMTKNFTICLRSVFPGMTINIPSDLGSAHHPSCLPVLSTSGSLFSCCSFLGSFLPSRSPLRCHSLKGPFPGHPSRNSLPTSLRPVTLYYFNLYFTVFIDISSKMYQ